MTNKEFEFELGEKVTNPISNFKGYVTVRNQCISMCNRYKVQPYSEDKDEKSDAHWFDEHELATADTEDGEIRQKIQKLLEKGKELSTNNTGPQDMGGKFD